MEPLAQYFRHSRGLPEEKRSPEVWIGRSFHWTEGTLICSGKLKIPIARQPKVNKGYVASAAL